MPPSNIGALVGRRVRYLRLQKGLSQERLAELMGISAQSVSRYERGALDLSLSKLGELADLLGAPIGALVEERADGVTDAEGDVLGRYRQLTERRRALVRAILHEWTD